MSDVGFGPIWLLVALLPGFVTAKVRDFFLPPRRVDTFDRWFEVVTLAVINYLVSVTGLLTWRWVTAGFDPGAATAGIRTMPPWGISGAVFLYLLSASSLVLGAGLGWLTAGDAHYRLARGLRLTSRTGREDVWQDVFSDVDRGWHLVHLADGRRVLGVARYFSDRGAEPSVYLQQASWIAEDGSTSPISGDGILVAEAARIQCVEFLAGRTNR